ncbi:MAG: Trp repressor protein [Firmicutes bacterium ADurb.Bin080]|jgi:TrpR-related protein YerC/YecD|nr:TrpR-related protein YerC/YecD [Clostridiales bacterium]OQC16303.1 MAG: Trp repressor protein [Firmicutes bacterium ADurb.Bin080]
MEKSVFGELYEIIVGIDNIRDCEFFFDDLCTKKEVEQMAQRVKAAKLLLEGKTYNQVIAETDISSATLSRVSRCVQYGKGYVRVLGRPKSSSDKK